VGRTRTWTGWSASSKPDGGWNDRLAAAEYLWAFVAATHTEPARQYCQRRRDRGDWHPAALRNLFNGLLGCLHHCLATVQLYDAGKAF
jgi:hypothetical protein